MTKTGKMDHCSDAGDQTQVKNQSSRKDQQPELSVGKKK